MTIVAERTTAMITEPGVYEIGEEAYFAADYALSCSGAKLLLPPSCPAKFFWQQDHPVYKDEFDLGSAAHKLVLGSGPEIKVIDAACIASLADDAEDTKTAKLYRDTAAKGDPDAWTTSAAKAARDSARAAGQVPVLARDYQHVAAMADAIRRHPLASALLNPELGHPEQSLFWHDPETGIPLRCRADWMRDGVPGRLVIPDYKTSRSAHPEKFAKFAADYGYHMQDAWYGDGARALGLPDPLFVFIVQEPEPPYLVSVVELDEDSRRAGRARNRRAIGIYQQCVESGEWPGYVPGNDIERITLPYWALRREEAY